VDVLSVKISLLDLQGTAAAFSRWIDRGEKKRVCVTPVNCLLWAREDQRLMDLYNSSDMNTADGVPIVLASKLLGEPIQGRVTGLDFLPYFAKVAAERGYSFFFLGAKEGVAEELSRVLRESYPSLNVAGCYSPPFAERFSEEENTKMISMINALKPNVLWVSLTAPKQDFWIEEHFDRLDVNVAIGVGGAFEVTAGLIPRSPAWMQRYSLEWLFRFMQEPRRLFRRYLVEAPMFIPLVLAQVVRKKLGINAKLG